MKKHQVAHTNRFIVIAISLLLSSYTTVFPDCIYPEKLILPESTLSQSWSEGFAAGTLVLTPSGYQSIEYLKQNDTIAGARPNQADTVLQSGIVIDGVVKWGTMFIP